MNIVLSGELLDEVECCMYLGSHVVVDRGIYVEVKPRMSEVGEV